MLATTTDPIIGAWMRGRLLIAGVRGRTPLRDTLDVITVLVCEVPARMLEQLRDELDIAYLAAGGDRSRWGTLPHQRAAMTRAMPQ